MRSMIRESRKLTDFIQPMLAKETREPFNDNNWIFEIKWDGYRAIAELEKKEVRLYSRNGNSFLETFPIVAEALKKLNLKAVLDGEIVVLDENGHPNFQLIQNYENSGAYQTVYYVFDLLFLNGKDITGLPLLERKALLKKTLKDNDVIKYSDHVVEEGKELFEMAKEQDLEGIMAKRADSPYYTGSRTTDWLKVKHNKTAEAIIAGFTEPLGARKHIGALVLGVYDGDKLVYTGHTGGGFNDAGLKAIYDMLKPLVSNKSPFEENVVTNTPVTWVKPKLICEIKFTEFTNDGKFRHPIFLRLRDDKSLKQITMDNIRPVDKNDSLKKVSVNAKKNKIAEKKTTTTNEKELSIAKVQTKNKASKPVIKESNNGSQQKKGISTKKTTVKVKSNDEEDDNNQEVLFDKIKVKTTNRNKIYFPELGITKGEVIDYYIGMADLLLPYLKGRPESLKRNPNGIHEQSFFHKDAGEDAPEWVNRLKIYSESADKNIDYIICDNKPTLTYLNNLGCIEINPWHSTIDNLDYPDYLIVDIDPSDNNTFSQVIEAARVIKEILDKAGAVSYCKTSGSTGLHIYVPTAKKYSYEQVKDFAYLVCMLASEQLPEFTTLERNLQKRGKERIYMDYLQNRKGQTISSVYSLRPKPGATVSTPLEWKEVKAGLDPMAFNIHTIAARIKKKGDLFKEILGKGVDLNKCLKKLEG